MSEINKKRISPGWLVCIIFVALIDLVLLLRRFLHGKNIALFNPKGLIAQEQHSLMVFTVAVLLVIAIPSLFIAYFTAWKYRESNTKAVHDTEHRSGVLLGAFAWGVPTVTLLLLATVMWSATHKLVPQKTIAADAKPLTIQVVSMRWKWLFIYPEQDIATVNFVQVPLNTPVEFELTADEAPMSSFWIPNLGGQLYSMTGHVNHLNLIADIPGDYPGSSAEINGAGFAGMKFIARASSSEDFDKWVQEAKQSPNVLSAAEYKSLLKPSENNTATVYSNYESSLYNNVVMKYMRPSEGHGHSE